MDEKTQDTLQSPASNEEENIISLSDLWELFARHWIPILLAGVIVAAVVFIYGRFLRTPMYGSTSTLYILKQQNSSADVVYDNPSSDFSLALNIVNDCSYMVKSHAVLDTVIEELHLDKSYNALYNMIKISNPEKSRILEITVTTEDPHISKTIADKISVVAAEKINDTLGTSQINIYSNGVVPSAPNNTLSPVVCLACGIGAMVAMYLVFLIIYLLDDKIKDEADVQKYLGLSVLGDIPNGEDTKSKTGKYRYRYYSYGHSKYQPYKSPTDDISAANDSVFGPGKYAANSSSKSKSAAADKGGKTK